MDLQGKSIPEITVKSFVLGVVLAIVLAAANGYLGLFAGMTVSASIPAAVVSMAVLRLFRRSTILKNNMVQTVASAGGPSGLAAGQRPRNTTIGLAGERAREGENRRKLGAPSDLV